MARKSAVILKSQVPTDPVERAWHYFQIAEADYNEAWDHVNSFKLNNKTSNGLAKGYDEGDYQAALKKVERTMQQMFRNFDLWNDLLKKSKDLTLSNVDVEDAKAIVRDSLGYSTAGMQFTINVGLLSHQMTEAVFKHRVREEEQDAPLCEACS